MNDSLDFMRRDFMNQFNKLGETEVGSANKSYGKVQTAQGSSPLAKLVAQHAYNSTKDEHHRATLIDKDIELKRL
jgi:hypothetical protein